MDAGVTRLQKARERGPSVHSCGKRLWGLQVAVNAGSPSVAPRVALLGMRLWLLQVMSAAGRRAPPALVDLDHREVAPIMRIWG